MRNDPSTAKTRRPGAGAQPGQQDVQGLFALYSAGRLAEAEARSRELIETFPDALILFNVLGAALTGQRKLDEAADCYRQALKIKPGYAEAHYNLGSALQALGRTGEAAASYREAIKFKSDLVEAHGNLGVALQALGQHEDAVASYRQALQLRPDYGVAHNNLGNALKALGRFGEAVSSYQSALAHGSDFAEIHYNLGGALQALGRFEEAVAGLRRALELEPDYAEAHNALGNALKGLRRLEEAAACYRKAVEIRPDFADARNNLGDAQTALGRFGEAIASYREALEIDAGAAGTHNLLGFALMASGRPDEAMDSYRRALEIDPDFADAHNNLGTALEAVGESGEAAASFRRALEIDPDFARALGNLASSGRNVLTADELAAMKALYERPGCPADRKLHLAFALGRVLEERKDFKGAIACFREGNRLKRETIEYDGAASAALFDRLRTLCGPGLVDGGETAGNPSTAPIFILGMPRSGSTLVEQILASHPQVSGAGEVPDFAAALREEIAALRLQYPDGIAGLGDAGFAQLAENYLRRLTPRGNGAPRITDKTLPNFLYAGVIARALPAASIVHVRRDPMDTCFSIYANNFAGRYPYAYDLAELGGYYRLYEGLMEHWRQLMPNGLIEISYEDLVGEPGHQIRRLLEACGLPFDQACVDFHENKRAVLTTSVTQVRQPIYRDSVARWRRFEDQLGPLRQALEG